MGWDMATFLVPGWLVMVVVVVVVVFFLFVGLFGGGRWEVGG